MNSRKRLLIVVCGVIAVGIICAVLAARFFDRIVIAAFTPRSPFDAATAPAPPDYADPAAWSALPTQTDAADAEVLTLRAGNQTAASVDVFYVHPTSYIGSAWNAELDDETVNAATDRGATRIQASAFNGCCAVYAPRYRQANLTAFIHPSPDGAKAIELAGDDVIAAFRHYLDHDNHGRPFIIAAHSQGSVHGFRLLKEVVAGTALQDRLVAAYLIGGPLTEAALEAVPDLPVCAQATDIGCVVGWNARSEAYRQGLDFVESPAPAPGSPFRPRVCVNPLTWRHDEEAGGRELNRGAVFFDDSAAPPAPRPGFASARCRDGTLVVEFAGTAPRDFASRLLDHALGKGNYHPIEYGLFFVNLRDNAQERADAFLK